jgi:hypothetical protein
MEIVLVAAGPLLIALGHFRFGQAAGLLSGLHNAVLIDVGAGVAVKTTLFIAHDPDFVRRWRRESRARGCRRIRRGQSEPASSRRG